MLDTKYSLCYIEKVYYFGGFYGFKNMYGRKIGWSVTKMESMDLVYRSFFYHRNSHFFPVCLISENTIVGK